ncbi:MaoC family dehydratase [Halopseudomonas pachastrellae]|nr:MaoC family dehydratase [Halopseudomonas pachastrellae]
MSKKHRGFRTSRADRKAAWLSRDFLATWEQCEFWNTVEVGGLRQNPRTFVVQEEDVLAYNKALGETHPLFIDPEYARSHAPHGTVIVHPVFITTIAFWFAQPGDGGSWIRTPGARNPFQHIEIFDPIRVGDRLTQKQETSDRFWRRDKAYITTHSVLTDQNDRKKVEFWGTLILPPTADDVRPFATA